MTASDRQAGPRQPEAARWVAALGMMPHPEGGWYREVWRSARVIDGERLPGFPGGPRALATSICFLLEGEEFSALHRLRSDEVWCFHDGGPLLLSVIDPGGDLTAVLLGTDPSAGEVPQAVVPAGSWFGARPRRADSWTLVGCVVAPGFDFRDFEMGGREELLSRYPKHAELIRSLTRG